MAQHTIDKKNIREAVRLLLEAIGEDLDRDGLQDTPDRAVGKGSPPPNHALA